MREAVHLYKREAMWEHVVIELSVKVRADLGTGSAAASDSPVARGAGTAGGDGL